MRLFKKLKEGFTLVELVVVIAVIAILSGVGVGTYIAVTNNAKKSNDQQVLTQVNTCLMMHENLPGQSKPRNMQEALDVLDAEMGVSDVQKLLTNTYSGYSFAWDDEADRFVILEGDSIAFKDANYSKELTEERKHHYWKMVSTVDSTSLYSQYVTGISYPGTGEVTVNAGFDAGKNSGIMKVTYESSSAKTIIVRTNGGNLVINAIHGTVYHYGQSGDVKVINIDSNSYHEAGRTSFLDAENGHIVVENDAKVEFLAASNTATITNNGQVVAANIDLPGSTKIPTKTFDPAEEMDGYYKLDSDVSLKQILHINPNKNVIIDLNGHSIVAPADTTVEAKYSIFMIHNGGKLTINDSVGTGKIDSTNKLWAAIIMTAADEFKVEGETNDVPATLVFNGGTVIGQYYGISGNGSEGRSNTEIIVNGGKVCGSVNNDNTGIYHPQKGKLIITGGLIEGSTGIYIKCGDSTLDSQFTGGTVRSNGAKQEFKHSGNGMNSTGDAIVIENCDYPGGTPSLSLGNINLEAKNGFDIGAHYYGDGIDGICGITSISNRFSLNDGYKWEQTITGIYKVVKK